MVHSCGSWRKSASFRRLCAKARAQNSPLNSPTSWLGWSRLPTWQTSISNRRCWTSTATVAPAAVRWFAVATQGKSRSIRHFPIRGARQLMIFSFRSLWWLRFLTKGEPRRVCRWVMRRSSSQRAAARIWRMASAPAGSFQNISVPLMR